MAQFAASTTPPSTTTITQDQSGTAFGMEWRCTYDRQIGQYRLDIQGGGGPANIVVTRTKVGVQFNLPGQYNPATGQFDNKQVAGPALELNTWVKIRQFRNAGEPTLSLGSGIYRTLETRARTSYVSSPDGPIKLTYDYNCIDNTGRLTVDNIKGDGRFVYGKSYLNPSPGDPRPESPSANPVQSIDFQLQGGDSYNGGINVFVPGKADPAITVFIKPVAGGYGMDRGIW